MANESRLKPLNTIVRISFQVEYPFGPHEVHDLLVVHDDDTKTKRVYMLVAMLPDTEPRNTWISAVISILELFQSLRETALNIEIRADRRKATDIS